MTPAAAAPGLRPEFYQTVRLALLAAAGSAWPTGTGPACAYLLARAARVRHLHVSLPTGSAGNLEIIPGVLWNQQLFGIIPFAAPPAYQFLAGDDNEWDFSCDVAAPVGSELVVQYLNTDAVNAHEFRVDVTLYVGQAGVG